MGREYELKFNSTPQVQAEVLEAFPGQTVRYTMETTYYDTRDRQISGHCYTLRRRLENGHSICTLKIPDGQGKGKSRREFEVECDRIQDSFEKLCKLGAPELLLQLSEPVPICGARFTRIARTVSYGTSILELAIDSGVLLGGGREIPLCEIEAELKSGTTADCDAFGAILKNRFHLQPEPKSKFCRAYELCKGV